ncbi:hypothetical protein HOY82DRAFT_650933 [Tuber indicum]|nr:hypothetical protein HOY82DRAFT_650933 [Tuber indicum]
MSYEFRSGQDGSARRLDPPSHLTSGIVDHYGTNVRTLPIMDTLAHLSVSQPYSQVVAIALQLKPGNKEIRLTIAENQDVRDSLVNHLYNIWGKLQALSDEYAEQRVEAWDENQRIEELDDDQILSPEIPLEMKRVDKWLGDLSNFMEELHKHRTGVDLEGFEQNLSKAVVALVLALELVFKHSEKQLTDDEWEKAKLVLADSHGLGCDNLARESKGDLPGDPFQLQRALEKLTSLPRHIESLFGFAHSPRLRSALQYRMTICAVLGQAQIVKLPTSREKWKSFLEDACDEHNRWHAKDAMKLFQKFGLWERKCPVHCECGLIQCLQTKYCDSWDNVPAFSYIGVSELSCSACRVWIEAFNELGGPKFYTRGSHGKRYWPWGMPMAEGPLKKMSEKVLDEYITHLERKGRIKKRAANTQLINAPYMQWHRQMPVPFVPLLDENFEFWFEKGSLWQHIRSGIYNGYTVVLTVDVFSGDKRAIPLVENLGSKSITS